MHVDARADEHPDAAAPRLRRLPTAWLVTAFMGLQSTCFYVLVNWLPTIERTLGVDPAVAGLHLFLFQICGVLAGLAVPLLMRHHDLRAGAIAASLPVVVAMLGLLLVPSLVLVWALLAGAGQGASLVVALSLISLRGGSPQGTTRLSGMAQSLGYLLAACGPIAAGALAEATGGWSASLVLVGLLGTVQLVAGILAGRMKAPPLARSLGPPAA
jgi:CP family cyanate transporter-like MFS transporter